MNSLRDGTASNPELLTQMASKYDRVHTPARALSALGLQHHPSTLHIKNYRDPMHMKIVYHADPATMFQRDLPWSDLAPPRPADRPQLLPLPPGPHGPQHGQSHDAGAPGAKEVSAASSGHAQSDCPPVDDAGVGNALPVVRRLRGKQQDATVVVSRQDAAVAMKLEQPGGEGPGADELLRRYALQAMSALLEDDGSACDKVFSMPFSDVALGSLRWTATRHTEDDPLPVLDWGSFALEGHVFLQIIRKAVGDMVVPRSTGFRRTDWAVSFLKVTDVKKTGPDSFAVVVNSSPVSLRDLDSDVAASPVVLCLDALTLNALLGMRRWDHTSKLIYKCAMPGEDVTVVAALLESLLAAASFVLPGNDPLFTEKSGLLERMAEKNLAVCDSEHGWTIEYQDSQIVPSIMNPLSHEQRTNLLAMSSGQTFLLLRGLESKLASEGTSTDTDYPMYLNTPLTKA